MNVARAVPLSILSLLVLLTGCAVNPVTGKTELSLVSEAQEIQIGTENYAFMQQSGGGEYDVDPELTEYIQGVGSKLAAVSDRELPYEFVVLNSSIPNAWALPGGKIAINRGLLTEMESEAELASVLGHEIVHAAAKHTARQMSRGALLQAAVVGTAAVSGHGKYGDFAVGTASVGAQLITQAYGRDAELESDEYGMYYMSRAGYDPQGAVDMQEAFLRLSEGRESDWLSGLFASHPPSADRVEANKRTAARLPAGGDYGRERYAAVMKMTMDTRPAYEAYDEGSKALADGDHELAAQKAEEAIALFADEAHFYGLRGDARFLAGEYEMAVRNYDIAIRRREEFFQYHLGRGLAKEKLGNDTDAFEDLKRSADLLPTASAYYELGNIESRRGNIDEAIGYYTPVAEGQGDIAKTAMDKLIRLDLGRNPDKYVQFGCYADSTGNLIVAVGNATPLAIEDVRFAVSYRDSTGTPRRHEDTIRGPIAAGERGDRATGIGPYTNNSGCPVEIIGASIAE